MASLWKRANGPQYRMLRIVAGAVLNAAHHHPGRAVDRLFARSVAKRAVGTISAQWVEMLAAPQPASSGTGRETHQIALRRKAQLNRLCKKGPAKGYGRWPPLAFAVRDIGRAVGEARARGQNERELALIYCLRVISRHARREMAG